MGSTCTSRARIYRVTASLTESHTVQDGSNNIFVVKI